MTPALTWTVWSVITLSTPLATVDVAFVAPGFSAASGSMPGGVSQNFWAVVELEMDGVHEKSLDLFKVAFFKVKRDFHSFSTFKFKT